VYLITLPHHKYLAPFDLVADGPFLVSSYTHHVSKIHVLFMESLSQK